MHLRTVGEWVRALWWTTKMSSHRSWLCRPDYDCLPSIVKETADFEGASGWCECNLVPEKTSDFSLGPSSVCSNPWSRVASKSGMTSTESSRPCLSLSPWGASACEQVWPKCWWGLWDRAGCKNHQYHKTRLSNPSELHEVSVCKIKSLTGYQEPPKLSKIHVFVS